MHHISFPCEDSEVMSGISRSSVGERTRKYYELDYRIRQIEPE